ncbi:hypothetical protein F5Y02DRAFT_361764 [Annulohypoxylon stygium]|nr:hypothetical protein F5Y02DRAFT_361764 [Annulohypoxylon stygium]
MLLCNTGKVKKKEKTKQGKSGEVFYTRRYTGCIWWLVIPILLCGSTNDPCFCPQTVLLKYVLEDLPLTIEKEAIRIRQLNRRNKNRRFRTAQDSVGSGDTYDYVLRIRDSPGAASNPTCINFMYDASKQTWHVQPLRSWLPRPQCCNRRIQQVFQSFRPVGYGPKICTKV